MDFYSQRSRYIGANPEQAKHHMKSGPRKMRSTGSGQHQSNRGRRYLEHRENGFGRSPASSMSLLSALPRQSSSEHLVLCDTTQIFHLELLCVWGLTPRCGEFTILWIFRQYNPTRDNIYACIYIISALPTRAKAVFPIYTDSPEYDVSQVWGSTKSILILSGNFFFFLT